MIASRLRLHSNSIIHNPLRKNNMIRGFSGKSSGGSADTSALKEAIQQETSSHQVRMNESGIVILYCSWLQLILTNP